MDIKAMVIKCENGVLVQRIEVNEKGQGVLTGQWVVGMSEETPASNKTELGKFVTIALTPTERTDEPVVDGKTKPDPEVKV